MLAADPRDTLTHLQELPQIRERLRDWLNSVERLDKLLRRVERHATARRIVERTQTQL